MNDKNHSDIYQDGRHYDSMFAWAGEDLAFWLGLAHLFGGPILELACGTGRVSLALAKAGFQVTGIDNAAGMLQEAREKVKLDAPEPEWVEADMRTFELGNTFPLIILPANALSHLLHLRDFEACFAAIRKHLAPLGTFAFEVFVPKMELLINRPGQRTPFAEYNDPDGRGRIVVTESYIYEADTQIKHIKTHHQLRDAAEEQVGELNLRMYFPQELDALIKYNGFRIDNKYSTYSLEPFDASAEKQLVVCRAED
jgi:SAM-dependent methyltransferase